MKKRWTRRKFLQTSLQGSFVVGGGTIAGFAPVPPDADPRAKLPPRSFTQTQHEVLRAAMDELIPAVDGMPAASEVGGLEYLDRLAGETPSIRQDLEGSLSALEELSRSGFGKSFASLSSADRIQALRTLEQQPALFASLRDVVYEAYYIQPKVWKLIGYEFHATNEAGPTMKPFDDSVLAQVRKMPKHYREDG